MKTVTRTTLRLDFATGAQLGPGKIKLLELIDRWGSIRAAGAEMGMSYRRAWLLADEINRMFREQAIAKQHGGRRGGGAALTPFGRAVIANYRAVEAKAVAAVPEELGWLASALDPDFETAVAPAGTGQDGEVQRKPRGRARARGHSNTETDAEL